ASRLIMSVFFIDFNAMTLTLALIKNKYKRPKRSERPLIEKKIYIKYYIKKLLGNKNGKRRN
ncbi:MAG: hypothetical protein IJS51_01255, partial [Treponema sp.]|nr:hypothetical protein [Treponema sp.]